MTGPARVVMAIDPGIRHVGVGIVARYGGRLDLVDSAHIDTEADEDIDDRERRIWLRLARLCKEYRPGMVGYEDQRGVNVAARMNAKRAFAAMKRGEEAPDLGFGGNNDPVFEVVGIAKAIAWSCGSQLFRYTAQQAKIAVLGKGNGHAEKKSVRDAVRRYFPGYETLMGRVIDLNESDAIAGAIHCERVTFLGAKATAQKARKTA